ncbi:MAG: metal-dependent phosphohydrolase [Acidimicrobiales bacterium]|nr:metal-dependent phosphohydrolase [Acidimicrobiales bacterium]
MIDAAAGPSAAVTPAQSLDAVLALYERWGVDPYDEDLSQLDHALQTAALASAAGADDALVAAALLHDVGHLLDLEARGPVGRLPGTDLGHEATGARYLSRLFAPAVTGPIALHVRAKRYRCAVDGDYHARLSDGSRRSLQLQGGPLAEPEVVAFAANPRFQASVDLRAWDDEGKVDGLGAAPLDHYRPLLARLVRL